MGMTNNASTEAPATQYRLRVYTLTPRGLRMDAEPIRNLVMSRDSLERALRIKGVPAVQYQGIEAGQITTPIQELTWAPLGTCPNAWHVREGQGTVSRCQDCPSMEELAAQGKLTEVDVLREVMRALGLPVRNDLLQNGAQEVDVVTGDASVAVRVPGGRRFAITVEDVT